MQAAFFRNWFDSGQLNKSYRSLVIVKCGYPMKKVFSQNRGQTPFSPQKPAVSINLESQTFYAFSETDENRGLEVSRFKR